MPLIEGLILAILLYSTPNKNPARGGANKYLDGRSLATLISHA
jgi:hypothetical protein